MSECSTEIIAAVLGGLIVILVLIGWAEWRRHPRVTVPDDDGHQPRTTPEQRYRNAGEDL